jgi:hypothetical protein
LGLLFAGTPFAPVPSVQLDTCARAYARRRPETTVLFGVLRDHLQTFLASCVDETGRGLPMRSPVQIGPPLAVGSPPLNAL